MKIRNILLILIIIVVIPEILLISYLFGNYNISIPSIPTNYATDFVSFLFGNPMFFVIIVIVIIVMFILYFALQVK